MLRNESIASNVSFLNVLLAATLSAVYFFHGANYILVFSFVFLILRRFVKIYGQILFSAQLEFSLPINGVMHHEFSLVYQQNLALLMSKKKQVF